MRQERSELKRLLRKVRRAKRLDEPYAQWLGRIEQLDQLLSHRCKDWKRGVYRL